MQVFILRSVQYYCNHNISQFMFCFPVKPGHWFQMKCFSTISEAMVAQLV